MSKPLAWTAAEAQVPGGSTRACVSRQTRQPFVVLLARLPPQGPSQPLQTINIRPALSPRLRDQTGHTQAGQHILSQFGNLLAGRLGNLTVENEITGESAL